MRERERDRGARERREREREAREKGERDTPGYELLEQKSLGGCALLSASRLGRVPGETVLDLMCGSGNLLLEVPPFSS